MNSQYLIERFLDIDYEIEDKFFRKISFKDEELEKKFQTENITSENNQFSLSNLIVILGYLATFLYIFFAFYRVIFFLTCCFCFTLTIISIIVSMKSTNIKFKLLNDHIQIFLSSFNLWFKAMIICIFYNTPDNDNIEELLRIIIYDFVSTNIFIIVKIEADYRINLFYFFQSLTVILFCEIYSNRNHFFFLEIITSFFVYLIFFSLRKEWDHKLRRIFSQKYKFEKTYYYIQEYLIGLNGYNMNIKNANNFYINEKMDKLIKKLASKNVNYSDDFFIKIKYKYQDILENENEGNLLNDNFLLLNFLRENNGKIQSNEDHQLIELLDNLIFFKNKYKINGNSNNFPNSGEKSTSEKQLTLLGIILKEYVNNKIYLKNNKTVVNHSSTLGKIRDLFIRLKYYISKSIRAKYEIERNQNSSDYKQNLKLAESKLEIKFDKYERLDKPYIINYKSNKIFRKNFENDTLKIKNSCTDENFLTSNCINFKKKSDNFQTNHNDKTLSFLYSSNLKSNFNLKSNNSENFVSIGNFYFENKENLEKSYFNILHRSMKIGSQNLLEDYFIYEITELINDKRIIEENIKKQKIFAKISHEFKTPLNSIISLIDNISIDFQNNQTSKNFKIIKNLSNYLLFLIADIVQYSQITEIHQIPINKKLIGLKSIIIFCYEILKTLISCNKLKRQNIVTNFIYQDEIDMIKIEADEIRLKQVILNFVSNSVKFTREGQIFIKCKLKSTNSGNFIKISVKDSGIGIRDDEKEFIGKDFSLINKNLNFLNNQIGSGLGLSICKSLIELMGFIFLFKSKFCHGSKF